MDSDKKPEAAQAATPPANKDNPPPETADQSNDGLVDATSGGSPVASSSEEARTEAGTKQPSTLKGSLKRFRVYLLLLLLLIVVGVIIAIVISINGKKTPSPPAVASQTLTPSELRQSESANTTVGGSGQTLTIQGNAIFTGQGLVRGSLSVAGTLQSGGQLSLPQIKVGGNTSFTTAQIGSLQVATGATFQGLVTAQNGINIAGGVTFTGPVSVASLTDTSLILSTNAQIEAPDHITFSSFPTGAVPGRQISFSVLGNGGSASVFGSDTSGTVTINTGNNPTPGCFITLIFNIPFTNIPNILISPVNIGAGETKYYITETATSFRICTNNAAPSNQSFAFDYFVGATPN